MAHEETKRLVPGAKTAVLFIHGICGTPDHFRSVLPLEDLVPEDCSVYNLRLDGHGGTASDFGRSSMEEWKRYVWQIFEDLTKDHQKVILVGHSMGTLFSIQLAASYSDRVCALFLLGVPLRVRLRLFGVRNFIRFGFGELDEKDPVQKALKLASGITPTKKVWRYLPWIPRMLELFVQMRETVKCLKDLSVPTFAFQSRRDEVVSLRSGERLEESGRVFVKTLPGSTHFYYPPEEANLLQQQFLHLLVHYR